MKCYEANPKITALYRLISIPKPDLESVKNKYVLLLCRWVQVREHKFYCCMGLIFHPDHDPVTEYLLITLNNNFTCMSFSVGMVAKSERSWVFILQLVLWDTCTKKELLQQTPR